MKFVKAVVLSVFLALVLVGATATTNAKASDQTLVYLSTKTTMTFSVCGGGARTTVQSYLVEVFDENDNAIAEEEWPGYPPSCNTTKYLYDLKQQISGDPLVYLKVTVYYPNSSLQSPLEILD